MTSCFLAIDIGTSFSKGIVIDDKVSILAEEFIAHTESPSTSGFHEHNADTRWWQDFVDLSHRLLDQLSSEASIEGVCISGMWPNFCPADMDGSVLGNAILYNDSRSIDIVKTLAPNLGSFISGYEYIPRMIWLQQHRPTVWAKTRKIFTTHNLIVYRLTGEYCIDSLTASVLGNLFDGERFEWRREFLSEFGISVDLLPHIRPPATIAGYVTESASKITGLKSGIPVAVGAGDTLISILGAGAHSENDGVIYYGSLGMFVRLTKDVDYLLSTKTFLEGEGIQWIMGLTDSGRQLEWVEKRTRNTQNFDDSSSRWDNFDRLAQMSEAGSEGILFVHNVQKHDDVAITVSPRAGIIGLTTDTSDANIARSILESFGYALRKSMEDAKLRPEDFKRVYAAGGGARSRIWKKIVSEIIRIPQHYYPSSAGAIGGAMLAGYALRAFNLKEIANYRAANLELPSDIENNERAYERNFKLYKKFNEVVNTGTWT